MQAPDPSWWTSTALEAFETLLPPASLPAATSDADLRDQIFRLKTRLGDTTRADRWRQDLDAARRR